MSERIKVVGDSDVEVDQLGLSVVLTIDPTNEYGERASTDLFIEEAKALRKALKRAIRKAKTD